MPWLVPLTLRKNFGIMEQPLCPPLRVFVRLLDLSDDLPHEGRHIVGVIEVFVLMVDVCVGGFKDGVCSEETGTHTDVALESPRKPKW